MSLNNLLLNVRGLTKSFTNQLVLDQVDLDIYQGKVLVILGPSGSGKTTLLRCLNALEVPEAGELNYADNSLSVDFGTKLTSSDMLAMRRQCGMVFQNYNLFPHKTALENITEGMVRVKKKSKVEADKIGMALLEKVGLVDKATFYPFQLSGGQQQRIGIARALAIQPKLILFDEPTSALDPELVQGMLKLMKSLANEGQTMVVVTHEIEFAREVADCVVFMEHAKIVEQGTPKHIFEESVHPRTREFLQRIQH